MTPTITGKRYEEMKRNGWTFRRVEMNEDAEAIKASMMARGRQVKEYRKTSGVRGYYHVLIAHKAWNRKYTK